MTAERIDRNEYQSFGRCIYCSKTADEVELTDEHIIPFSLGGNAVILKGSCKACAAETTKIENEVGRKVLWDFRTHAGVQTRRPKERPTELPFTYAIAGGARQTKTVPVQDHPYFVPLPVWGLPGIMRGKQPTTRFDHFKAHVFYWLPPNIKQTLGLEDGVLVELPFPEFRINHDYVARAIMKIAFCQMIAKNGLDCFRPLVTPAIILGRYPCIPYFIGCSIDDPPPPTDPSVMHVIQIGKQRIGQMRLVIVNVRLFANSGTDVNGPPTYQVIVGVWR